MSVSSSESELWRLEPSGSSQDIWDSDDSCSSNFSDRENSAISAECCYGCGHRLHSQDGAVYALIHRSEGPLSHPATKSTAGGVGVEAETTVDRRRELFHPECLVCWQCSRGIREEDGSCWWSRGRLTCLDCKTSLSRCQRCSGEISRDSWVHLLEGRAFHLTCLTCTLCRRQLAQGEACGLRGDRLLCASHLVDGVRSGEEDSDDSLGPSRSKRNRTSFSSQQVHVLQQCFYADPNPDGTELEKIAGKAKLSKRVAQVWFQNARARRKKQHPYSPYTAHSLSSPSHSPTEDWRITSPLGEDDQGANHHYHYHHQQQQRRLALMLQQGFEHVNSSPAAAGSGRVTIKEEDNPVDKSAPASWLQVYQQLKRSHRTTNADRFL